MAINKYTGTIKYIVTSENCNFATLDKDGNILNKFYTKDQEIEINFKEMLEKFGDVKTLVIATNCCGLEYDKHINDMSVAKYPVRYIKTPMGNVEEVDNLARKEFVITKYDKFYLDLGVKFYKNDEDK